MPRRALILSCLAALGSQLSVGCCCWRPFAHCWAGYEGGPAVGGCSSCGSSPIAGGPPAGPVLTGPPPGYAGYQVSAAPVMAQQGSVFTGPPTASFPAPTVTREAIPVPR